MMPNSVAMGIPLAGLERSAMKEKSERLEYLEGVLMSWMPYDDVPGQDENEKLYLERKHPTRSERYMNNLRMFNDWRSLNANREI